MKSETQGAYVVPLRHGRHLHLRLEPGDRPTPLYGLALVAANGMAAGGMTGTSADMVELLLAIERLARTVDAAGFPGE